MNDNLAVVNILIEHGADPLIENESGHLPSAYALQQRKELLFQFENNVGFVLMKLSHSNFESVLGKETS